MKANSNGKRFERVIEFLLIDNCVSFKSPCQPGFHDQLGSLVKVDFYIFPNKSFESGAYIEARYQNVPGSVDKKNGQLVTDIKLNYDKPTIVVIGGAGAKRSYDYMKEQLGKNLILVFNLTEFFEYVPQLGNGCSDRFFPAVYNANQKPLFAVH